MTQKNSDLRKIQELIDIMNTNDLVELEISHGNDKIHLKRSHPPVQTVIPAMAAMGHAAAAVPGAPAQTGAAEASAAQDEGLIDIKSPLVGTFYSAPSPDSEPYVEQGAHVENNSVVCIIEAMKVMNEIKSEISGTIAKIMVRNGQAVEYGQVLFKVKPD